MRGGRAAGGSIAADDRSAVPRLRRVGDRSGSVRSRVAGVLPRVGRAGAIPVSRRAAGFELVVAPNPAQKFITFDSDVTNPIQTIELFDVSGRSMKQVRNINSHFYQMDRGSLPNGLYIAKVKFEGGILSKKIILEQ